MKASFEVDRFRRVRLSAEPGEYDGRPQLQEIFLDLAPQRINRFRCALASALPFLHRVNGPLDTEHPVYPLTSSLLREFGDPFEVLASNVEWAPTDIPGGSGRLVITLAGMDSTLPTEGEPDSFELKIVRSDTLHGHLSATNAAVVASNAWLFGELEGSDALYRSLLAVAVLFAEDYDARTIEMRGVQEGPKTDMLARLVESVGLRLIREQE